MSGTLMHPFGGIGLILFPLVLLAFYALVVVAIVKVFQISHDLKEIKQRLTGSPPA